MSKRIKDKRRAKADKKAFKGMPQPDPGWVGAILAILLEKTGGHLAVSVETLEKFGGLKGHKFPEIIYDDVNQSVLIRLPKKELDNSLILKPNSKIITLNRG